MKTKCFCSTQTFVNLSLLIARLIIGGIFIYAGWMKLDDVETAALFFASEGFPAPTFFVYLAGLIELLGGIALVLGFFTKFVSLIFVVEMIIAYLVVHLGQPFVESQLVLMMIAGSFALAAAGAGEWRVCKKECACEIK